MQTWVATVRLTRTAGPRSGLDRPLCTGRRPSRWGVRSHPLLTCLCLARGPRRMRRPEPGLDLRRGSRAESCIDSTARVKATSSPPGHRLRRTSGGRLEPSHAVAAGWRRDSELQRAAVHGHRAQGRDSAAHVPGDAESRIGRERCRMVLCICGLRSVSRAGRQAEFSISSAPRSCRRIAVSAACARAVRLPARTGSASASGAMIRLPVSIGYDGCIQGSGVRDPVRQIAAAMPKSQQLRRALSDPLASRPQRGPSHRPVSKSKGSSHCEPAPA